MAVARAGGFGTGLTDPPFAVDPTETFDDHRVVAGSSADPDPLDVGDGLEPGELLLLALSAIGAAAGGVPASVWERLGEVLTDDDRAALRTWRNSLLAGGIEDRNAVIINQLTGATAVVNESGVKKLTWTDGTG